MSTSILLTVQAVSPLSSFRPLSLHLSNSQTPTENGKTLRWFWFFAHAGMCMAGTPTEDAYRHGEMVAVAILEASGGVRQDSPLVCQTPMLCSHRITDRIREITHLNLNSWKTLPGCLEIAALTR